MWCGELAVRVGVRFRILVYAKDGSLSPELPGARRGTAVELMPWNGPFLMYLSLDYNILNFSLVNFTIIHGKDQIVG